MSTKTEDGQNRAEDDTNEKPRPRCSCGIEIARAHEMCPERDCFYK